MNLTGWIARVVMCGTVALPGLTVLLDARHARAQGTETQSATLEEYCQTWAANGMLGVKVHLRNGSRKITYIDENELRYLLKHQAAGDNLYLLKGGYTQAHRRYLEESLLAGYDRSAKWLSVHAGQSPDISNWEAEAFAACMKDVPGAVRALLDAH